MSDAATPAAPATEAPVTPAATPAVPASETVSLTKEQHDQLVKDAARASSAQSDADRYKNILKKNGLLGGGHFNPAPVAPATPPSQEDLQAAGAAEDRKAEKGLTALALDATYREVLDKDPTLRDLFHKNPLAVLPLLAPDAIDADDALTLVKDALDKRKPAPAPATPPPTPAPAPVVPPVGGVNPDDKAVNEEVEAARKIPNTERAVSGMLGARLRGMKK